MQQTPHPGGDHDKISLHDEPVIYQAPGNDDPLPQTVAEAEQHNPFQLLTELREHALALMPHERNAEFHLTELALAAAVIGWWSRWQPVTMHRALVAGASLAEVAAATGMDEADA